MGGGSRAATICDEPFGHELRAEWFSRELVALEVERRMEAKGVIRILDAAVAERGRPPEFIRSDNGPEPSRAIAKRR